MKSSSPFSVRNICYISVFTAIIAVCAQISIPMPTGVPLTLQTFAIPLAGIILGSKKGTLSVLIYIILGISGIPVFTGFRGGIGVIFGVTGGYIISFPLMALCAGIASDLPDKFKKFKKPINSWVKNIIYASGLILGAVINYICGMFWGKFILECSLSEAFIGFVLPYIPTAVVKIILTGIIGASVKNILNKNNILN